MAATKTTSSVWGSQTLTAGAGNTTSSAEDMSASYGGVVHIKLTNGATGPTVAAQVQIEVSSDNSNFYEYGGPLVGNTDNNGTESWSVEIPIGVLWVRLVAGSNTAQNVTVDADIGLVTSL